MVRGSPGEIRAYCRKLVTTLGRPSGGFIASWYSDPKGAGHRPEAIEAMCEAFVALSRDPPFERGSPALDHASGDASTAS